MGRPQGSFFLLLLFVFLLLPANPGAAADPPPPSPLAAREALRITVSAAGMQELSAAELAAAGLNLANLDPSRLQLWRDDAPVPLEILAANGFAGLRFHAPSPGDPWNSTDTYWLTLEASPGTRMGSRSVGNTCANPVSTALQSGQWRAPKLYESRMAGPAGDYWYSLSLQSELSEPGYPGLPVTDTVTLVPALPLAPGPATLVLRGAALYSTLHRLETTVAGASVATQWAARGNFAHELNFPSGGAVVQLALQPNPDFDRIFFDSISYTMPAQLAFAGRGALFAASGDNGCYALAGSATGAALYDITDPNAPQRLDGWGAVLADTLLGRRYLLTGEGTLQRPSATAHAPVDLARPQGANAIYLAPRAFLPALEPLLAHRRAGGYAVAAIAVEDIYVAWGGGQLQPDAIRDFLRYARASWDPVPQAVVLVGDGTSDPRNYFGYGTVTHIPPYLAEVDPFLGQVACDNCYAQLDGASPLNDLLPDLLIGRLPVKNEAELGRLVQKIVGYETDSQQRAWRSSIAYIADNADSAGDFAAAADASAAQQPAGVRIKRVYYDPQATAAQPWRIRDPWAARQRTMATFSDGAAIVNYLGHGLYYQWAVTGLPLDPNLPTDKQNMLALYDPDELTNPARLSVVLSMTCLTGAFAQPNVSGTTIDERLVLVPGGAVAVWSSAGASIAPGQQRLLRGFYGGLWLAPPEKGRIGDLIMAGYNDLLTTTDCCRDMLRTFNLLGDPLMPVRVVQNRNELLLPMVQGGNGSGG
jgi:hypothetical protein